MTTEVTRPKVSTGEVLVSERQAPYANDVYTENHHFVLDEPKSVGGQDLGPRPTELLLAALGGCISITLRMYAEHKELPLEHIEVRLKRLVAEPQQPPKIIIAIDVTGDLDAAHLKRLQAISKRCPVHKLITGELEVEHQVQRVA